MRDRANVNLVVELRRQLLLFVRVVHFNAILFGRQELYPIIAPAWSIKDGLSRSVDFLLQPPAVAHDEYFVVESSWTQHAIAYLSSFDG